MVREEKYISKDTKAKKIAVLKIHNGGSGVRVKQNCEKNLKPGSSGIILLKDS